MIRNIKILITFVLVLLGNVIYSQTLKEVRDYINDSTDIKHKDIVLRQSIQETGWYNCKNCSMDNNNIFGIIKESIYHSHTGRKVCYIMRDGRIDITLMVTIMSF